MKSPNFRIKAVLAGFCLLALLYAGYSQEARPPEANKNNDLVLVNVTVTDPLNRIVEGLQKEHFRLFVNKTAQAISYFAHREVPVSIAIACDLSDETESTRKQSDAAVARFLRSANPNDEFFLVLFNDKASLIKSLSYPSAVSDNESYINKVADLSVLHQGITVGLQMLKKDCEKKALAVITAESKAVIDAIYTAQEVAKQSGLQVYTIQKHGWEMDNTQPFGRTYVVNEVQEVGYYLDLIYSELRNQYVLGYLPSGRRGPDSERKISVKLDPPKNYPKLTARVARDNYSPQQ